VVAAAQAQGLSVRYIRRPQNYGADANFAECFTQAEGRYVWLLGDDDLIVPGALRTILTLLGDGEYDLAYLSSYGFKQDHLRERRGNPTGVLAEIITDGSYFARRSGAMIAFLSVLVINKQSCVARATLPLEANIGTNLVQLGWVLPILAHPCRILYIAERLVAGRQFNTAGWSMTSVFGVNYKRLLEMYLGAESSITRVLLNNILGQWFPDRILEQRRGINSGMVQEDVCATLQPLFHAYWRYWLLVCPACRWPLSLAEIYLQAAKSFFRMGRAAEFLWRRAVHPSCFIKKSNAANAAG